MLIVWKVSKNIVGRTKVLAGRVFETLVLEPYNRPSYTSFDSQYWSRRFKTLQLSGRSAKTFKFSSTFLGQCVVNV